MIGLSKRLFLMAALSIILFAVISNYNWIKKDNSIFGIDSQNHLLFSIEFFDELSGIMQKSVSSVGTKITETISLLSYPVEHSDVYWPNGLNSTTSAFYFLFGRSLFSAKLSLLPYLFILLFSTYLIGKLIHSKSVGILALFLIFMYPIIFESSRQFQLDFPLTAMTALSILFLLKCDYFKDRKYSLLFGLSLGWAMLIKGQAILFIIWPLIFVLCRTFKDFQKETHLTSLKLRQLQNIAIFIIMAGLLASVWWLPNFVELKFSLKEHIFSAEKAIESHWSWDQKYSFDSMSFYFKRFFSSLSPFLFVAFLISFPFFLKQKAKYRSAYISWLIAPFLLFNFVFTIKEPRFLMPVLPAIALITAWGLIQIRNKKIQLPILFGTILFALMQFYILSYCDWRYKDVSIGSISIFGRTSYETEPPHKEDLNIDEVVQVINAYSSSGYPVKIGSIVACEGKPNILETLFWLKIENKFLEPFDLIEMPEQFLENFESLDFILIRIPLGAFSQWAGGEKFRILLNNFRPRKIYQHKIEDPVGWNNLLGVLENARSNFQLIGKIGGRDKARGVYYIYKRKKGIRNVAENNFR